MMAVHKQVIKTNENQVQGLGLSVYSPVSGKVFPLEHHPIALFSRGIMGCGVMLLMTGHKLYAPFDGTVEQIRAGGTEFILKSRQGVQLLISLDIDERYLPLSGLRYYVNQKQSFTAKSLLFYADFRQVKEPIHVAVTIINHQKLGGIYYSHQQVLAPNDVLFHITAKQRR